MTIRAPSYDPIDEFCDRCGRETPHQVSITFVTESKRARNAVYSRQPYRVTTCEVCGGRQQQGPNRRN